MIEFNLRMVISIAKKYCGKGVELGDLIPEGLLGLRKAIDKFDATKGFKFSTYSHWWIRQAVSRAVSDQADRPWSWSSASPCTSWRALSSGEARLGRAGGRGGQGRSAVPQGAGRRHGGVSHETGHDSSGC